MNNSPDWIWKGDYIPGEHTMMTGTPSQTPKGMREMVIVGNMESDKWPPGWCCSDCLMLLANGETDPDWSEEETAEYLKRVEHYTEGCEVTLGMFKEFHECLDESGEIADDCECEMLTFSWSPCDVCGSSLGGSRDAVTFWEKKE